MLGRQRFLLFIVILNQLSMMSGEYFIDPSVAETINIHEGTDLGHILRDMTVSGNPSTGNPWCFFQSPNQCGRLFNIAVDATNTRKSFLQVAADLDFENAGDRVSVCNIRWRVNGNGCRGCCLVCGGGVGGNNCNCGINNNNLCCVNNNDGCCSEPGDPQPCTHTTQTITINILNRFDVAPTLPLGAGNTQFVADCTEEQGIGTNTCTMTPIPVISDVETGNAYIPKDVLTCTIIGTTMFDVIPGTCVVNMDTILDRDIMTADVFTGLKLRVTDSGGNYVEQPLQVNLLDINDNTPVCPQYEYDSSFVETEPVGYIVTSIVGCSDKDKGVNALLTYNSTNANFAVDNVGTVTLVNQFDYDTIVDTFVIFKVYVADSPATGTPNTYTVTVTATILPINEHPPQYDFEAVIPKIETWPNVTGSVDEHSVGGSVLFTMFATDEDRIDTPDSILTYSLISAQGSNGASVLPGTSINPNSGQVYITDPGLWDYEQMTYVDVMVQVSDNGSPPLINVTTVRVAITPVNEFPPTFAPLSGFYEYTTPEGIARYTTLVVIVMNDPDNGEAAPTCTITNNADYYINGGRNVRCNYELNLDAPNPMPSQTTLLLDCTDGDNIIKATVIINITPVNQHPPVITANPPSPLGPYNEGTFAVGSTVTSFSVTDNDRGNNRDGVFDCVINSPNPSPFVLDGCNSLLLGTPLDRETDDSYTVIIDAIDRGDVGGSRTGAVTLAITVADANDNIPVCSPSVYTANLPENAAATNFVQVACPDADTFGVTYSLAINYGGLFSIDPTNGNVSVTAALDYETAIAYSLTVKSTDVNNPAQTATALVQVTVINQNDMVPVVSPKSISIPESQAVGSLITTMVITDDDKPNFDIKSIKITQATNNGVDVNPNPFTIDMNRNVYLTSPVNYEAISATPTYIVTVSAVDGAPTTGLGTLTVAITDVNDNAPICSKNLFMYNVSEAAPSTTIIDTLTVNDNDGTAVNKDPSFKIVSGDPTGVFNMGLKSGQLSPAGTPAMDYETTRSYSLQVEVVDKNGLGLSVTCEVLVEITDANDHPTLFTPSATTVNWAENTAVGTELFKQAAIDLDGDAQLSYALSAPSTMFFVDPATAAVSLISPFNYETKQSYTVNIVATEASSGDTATFTLTVNVDDVNEAAPFCNPTFYNSFLNETATTNLDVATIICTDVDTFTTTTYTVTSVNGLTGNDGGRFTTLGNVVKTALFLDYEATNFFTILVEARDGGTPSLTSTVTVSLYVLPIDEAAPVLASASTSVMENSAQDTPVYTLSATDSDTGPYDGLAGYRIVSGNANGYFRIEDDGKIYVQKPPDRETEPVVTLTVRAFDGRGLYTDATMTITVNDVNDNAPVFTPSSYVRQVAENAANPTSVIDFGAAGLITDADSAVNNNNDFGVTITSGNGAGKFAMNGKVLQVVGPLDVSVESVYVLQITATDRGTPALSTTIPVIIEVVPTNLNVPTFVAGGNPRTIPENETVGSIIFQAVSTDIDTALSGTVKYAIAAGNTNNDFYIDPNTGEIQVSNPLDYDGTIKTYFLTLNAIDQGIPAKTGTMTLTVSLTDVNDNSPVFTDTTSATPFTIPLQEVTTMIGANIYSVSVSDKDSGAAGTVTTSILTQSPANMFTYDDTTKVLSTTAVPDRETIDFYEVVLKAVDGGTTPKTTLQLLKIVVTDINDNTPSFSPIIDGTTYFVQEGNGVVVNIANFPATDPDLGVAGADGLQYSVVGINPVTSDFIIAPVTSTLLKTATGVTLDREVYTSYVLKVIAKDQGTIVGGPLTGSVTITVSLTDINDNPPIINPTVYTGRSISEDSLGGTVIATVLATDADFGINAILKYSIDPTSDPNNYFAINSKGEIFLKVNGTVDREIILALPIVLKVTVKDSGAPQQTAASVASVTISVLDINDNSPIFPSPIVRYITEGSPVATLVGAVVTATDLDTGANAALTYSIHQMLVGLDDFIMDATSGQISVKNANIDRETIPQYELLVRATDGGVPSRSGSVTVTIIVIDANDHTPAFQADYSVGISIDENVALGTLVTTITATDKDSGANGQLFYSMVTTMGEYTLADTLFTLDPNNGELTVKANIDREQHASVSFYVKASDMGNNSLSSTTYVVVTINDLDDNPPVYTKEVYSGEMAYNESRIINIVQVVATDADATGNVVSYGFSTSSTYLDIDTNTGWVTKRVGSTTAGKGAILIQNVLATDSFVPTPRTTEGIVRVDIYDPNSTIVCVTFSISEASFMSSLDEIKLALSGTLQFKYPSSRVGYYNVTVLTGLKTTGSFYAVANNQSDYSANTGVRKQFLSSTELLTYWRASTDGTPTVALQGTAFSSFPAIQVDSCSTSGTSNLEWYQEPWGIAVLTLLSLLGLAAIALSIWGITKCCGNAGAVSPSKNIPGRVLNNRIPAPKPAAQHPAPAPKVTGPKRLPNEVYYDKNLWKGTPTPNIFKNEETTSLSHTPTRIPTPVDVNGVNF